MGSPLRTVLVTLLVTATALAGEVVDASSGVKIKHSDDWERVSENEQGSRKIVMVHRVERGKYVMFVVQTGTADNFNADQWIENEKKSIQSQLSDVGEMKVDKERRIDGRTATGFTVSAKSKDRPLRIRAYIVRNGPKVVVLQEWSYHGAHEAIGEATLKEFWDGIAFQEAQTEVGEGQEGSAAESVEDTEGNYKIKKPAGWDQIRAAPTEAKSVDRTAYLRRSEDGGTVMYFDILRFEARDPSVFKQSPGEVIEDFAKRGLFTQFYGANSESMVMQSMRIDESHRLGAADSTAGYEISSRTMQQIAETREAEKKKAKGIKGVEVPDFKPKVIRGRIALLSPHIYIVRCEFRADVAGNAKLKAEYDKFVESFEFLQSGAKPPKLTLGPENIGDTMSDPANKKTRKGKKVFRATGKKSYQVEISYKLPPGFIVIPKAINRSVTSIYIVAQDSKNRWFKLELYHLHKQALAQKNQQPQEKDVEFESWKSNWESKARGKSIKKTDKWTIGGVKFEGYKELEGDVEGWAGTFTAGLGDAKGWRHFIEIETRGGFAEEYKKQVKAVLKGIKLKPKK
ncbi:MAG: hypothetical protein ACYTHK_05335 [Planctomycetota bacterium]|jgi:hypothetical protein